MRRRPLFAIGMSIAILVLAAAPAIADPGHVAPGGPVTDDPSGAEDAGAGLDGSGISTVERFLGSQPPATASQKKSRNISLVGSLGLTPSNQAVHADVAGYLTATRDLAFVGKWRGACPGTGVDIIDITNPKSPVKLSDTTDFADTSMEDMDAVRIGNRDVLAVGLQDCANNPTPGVGKSGLELVDITDPVHPTDLSIFDVDQFGADVTGVHELDVTTTPTGRVLALLTVPDLEAITSDANGLNGVGDLLIVDITDPTNPTLAGEWGVLDEFGLSFYLNARQGADARTLLHGARANDTGTTAYLSYWDAGFIVLDISDPSNPVVKGRTSYPAGVEGNAHSLDTARNESLLIGADEDTAPFHLEFTSSAFSGTRDAVEAAFTSERIVTLPGRKMTGEVVNVGRGCPAGSINGTNPADPYLADPSGKIALIERGACRFDNKIARAQQAGATGVIVYNNAAGGDALVLMGGNDPMTLPDGTTVDITLRALFVGRSTGLLLIGGTPPVTINAEAVFDGWGGLHFYNISNPASPVELSQFFTADALDPNVALNGTFTVHNPEVRGSIVYASWYSDGARVIDFSHPSTPKEIGFWAGAGSPAGAPAVNLWSVVPHNGLLLASDRNFGLYILKVNSSK